jgi:uncharacterized repeat protein (TIGR03806 family)
VVRKTGVALALNGGGALNLSAYRLLETRLLVRYAGGWKPLPYIWNDAQTDALLEIAGGVQRLEIVAEDGSSQAFDYIIPDANQCGGCHAPNHSDQEIAPIGPRVDQLNRVYTFQSGPRNQLTYWAELQKIDSLPQEVTELPRRADWTDSAGASVEQRARAYLDANCAHCHNPQGAADTSGLHLDMDAPEGRNLGICKPPVAAGRGSGDRLFDIYPGRPDDSILLYRMQHSDPAIAMPELGRSLNHVEGVALIRDWITELPGSC